MGREKEKNKPLGHFLDDEKALLDDFDRLAVANELLLGGNNGLAAAGTIKVVDAEEVIEAAHGREPTPVVEGLIGAGSWRKDSKPFSLNVKKTLGEPKSLLRLIARGVEVTPVTAVRAEIAMRTILASIL